MLGRLVVSDSLQPHGLQPTRPPLHGDSPGKNTGVGCLALLQRIFPTQGSNPGLPHCRWNFLPTELPGKPKNTGVGSLSLLQEIFPTQESNRGILHCMWILYQQIYQGTPTTHLRQLQIVSLTPNLPSSPSHILHCFYICYIHNFFTSHVFA